MCVHMHAVVHEFLCAYALLHAFLGSMCTFKSMCKSLLAQKISLRADMMLLTLTHIIPKHTI